MQKGHLRTPVLSLPLLTLLLLCSFLFGVGASSQRPERAVGPLIPLNGLSALSHDPAARPFIGRQLPTPPIYLFPQQGTGTPTAVNFTASATSTQEISPHASPMMAQSRIVFLSDGQDADRNLEIDPIAPPAAQRHLNIWLMRENGTQPYQLLDLPGDQLDPAYDPSGRFICFASPVADPNDPALSYYQLFVVPVNNPANVQALTTGASNKRHPSWSPDGAYIAYQDDVNGNWDIYRIRATGAGAPEQLTSNVADEVEPAWAPTGFLIAFTRLQGGIGRIWAVTPDGSSETQLSNGGGSALASDRQPAWRNTGTEIFFASDRYTSASDSRRDFNLWRMPAVGEAQGAKATLIWNTDTADTADDTEPCFVLGYNGAPNRLCFTSTRAGTADIWALELQDWTPPLLGELPTVEPRQATPGADVTISVPVSDREGAVQRVVAYFKDPDRKIYATPVAPTSFDAPPIPNGMRYLEIDCAIVDSLELKDEDEDGVYSGVWTTPTEARDYIVDILVVDEAGNAQLYDDIYGFTTRAFVPLNKILFVDDYCEGQLFLAQLGWNNVFSAAWPVESYYTFNPSYVPGLEGTTDFDSIRGAFGEGYDVWRIICRGPVPASVYQAYLPTMDYQLDPAKLDNQGSVNVPADRPVPAAPRAIIWAAPHAGSVWTAEGSIIDATTQADLALFVQRGGRLLISGEDIAWALTMNGTRANAFLTNTLRARFVSDIPFDSGAVTTPFLGKIFQIQRTAVGFDVRGVAGDPVATDPWGGSHFADSATDNWFDEGDNPTDMNTSWNNARPAGEPADYHDCADFSVRPDVIDPINATVIYTADPGTAVEPSRVVGIRYRLPTGAQGSVVYLSFGFEQLNRGYHQPAGMPPHCRNVRSHLIHNAICWLCTSGFAGRVLALDSQQPISDPLPIVCAKQNGVIVFAVRCQADGSFVMRGLPAGIYDLEASCPGYETQFIDGQAIHGGLGPYPVQFALKRLQPAQIIGRVTAQGTGNPLENVEISIRPAPDYSGPAPTLPDPVRTGADGTYTLPNIPPGKYIVRADGADIQYGAQEKTVSVVAGDTATVDFVLAGAAGTLKVTVLKATDNSPLRNAQVSVRNAQGQRTTAYTDDTGVASVSLTPGDYTVTITAPGYQTSAAQTVTIQPGTTTEITVALQPVPGGGIVGRVVSANTGAFVGGVTIRVFFGTEEIARTTTSDTAVTTINGTPYNYQLTNVSPGTVRVTAESPGLSAQPAERTVQVQSGLTTRDVNFTMTSLHTFPVGLQLISFPWDYSDVDPKELLGIGTGSWGMATWDAAAQEYQIYPAPPADRFRLGVGYWMRLQAQKELTQEGTPAPDPVELRLQSGWNLIGCPYTVRLDFYTARVRNLTGTVYSLQDAMTQGIIGSSLYAYVMGGYQSVAALSPYTGYWLRANEPCWLILSRALGAMAAETPARDESPRVPDGWLLQLRARVGGVQDAATYLGWSRQATAGCDFGLDQFKPPVPAMGPYVYVAIDNRDWQRYPGDYAVDVRPAEVATSWNLTVYTNQVGERVTLTWDDLSLLPANVRPVLRDLETGQQIYMRTSVGYSFEATAQPRRLQVQVSPAGVGQLAIMPQAATPTAAGVSISYVLTRAAQVEIVIANIAGRTVRRLGGAQMQPAGQNVLLWDGRDERGRQVPAGRYLITIIGRTETGQECRAVLPAQKIAR